MLSKNDIYMIVVLGLCFVFAIININYANSPDNKLQNIILKSGKVDLDENIAGVNKILSFYNVVYKLCIVILTFIILVTLIILLKYTNITHKALTVFTLFSLGLIVLLSLIVFIYGFLIGTVRLGAGELYNSTFSQFWRKSFMGSSPIICGGLGLLLIPSIYTINKQIN